MIALICQICCVRLLQTCTCRVTRVSMQRHSVEGDALSKRPGWWKRLKLAVFPTMNLRKGKEDKPLSVDHATPTARATSQKFSRGTGLAGC